MPKMPDLEAWAVFAKVAEKGSYARAADDLGLGHPTVSKIVARLETRLGTALFHRTSRRLVLTESGRISLDRATRILAEGEAVEAEAQAQAVAPRGLIKVAVPTSFGLKYLAPLLPGFLGRYPDVSIDMHVSDAMVDLVADGYDLSVRISGLPDSSLVSKRVATTDMLLVGSPDYFVRHGRPTHPQQLSDHVALGYAYGRFGDTWRMRHHDEREVTVSPRRQLRINNSDALLPSLLAGLGLAVLPEFLIWRERERGQLTAVLEDWLPRALPISLLTPSSKLRPARLSVFMEYLAEQFNRPDWMSFDAALLHGP